MTRTITKLESVRAFEDLLDSLSMDKVVVIVDKSGERVAVIVSPEEFDQVSHARFWATVDRVQKRNADKDPDEVLEFVTQVVEEVRQERHERERSTGR